MTAVTPRVRLGRPARPGRIAAWFRAPLPQPPAFWRIAVVVGSLALLGLLMVLSASSVIAVTSSGSAWSVFLKQAVWLSIGSVAFFVGARVDYHRWQRWAMPLWGAALLLCLAVFVPSVGIEVDGGRRWIGYGDFRMQPSELAKLALLVVAAAVLTRRADAAVDARRWAEWVRPMAILFGPLAAAVFFEPDMDSVVVLAFLALVMIVVAGVPGRVLVTMTAVGLPVVAVLALVERYRIRRILALVDPAGHEAVSYQTVQSVMAMGRGGFFGVGIGAGRAKWHYLPNAHTDFIFSIIGEELGLIGTLAVLGAFAFLAVVGFGVARRSPDRFGALLAAGITAWIAGQAVINLGAVAGVLPVAGITLPFLSAGGSSLVVTLFAAGILANVARLTPDAPPRPAPRRSRP